MAAVTVNSQQHTVAGNRRRLIGNIDIAADADTWNTNMKAIEHVSARSVTNNAIGATVAAGVITFQTAGAEAGVTVEAVGY